MICGDGKCSHPWAGFDPLNPACTSRPCSGGCGGPVIVEP
jgi:hypothetical protein